MGQSQKMENLQRQEEQEEDYLNQREKIFNSQEGKWASNTRQHTSPIHTSVWMRGQCAKSRLRLSVNLSVAARGDPPLEVV